MRDNKIQVTFVVMSGGHSVQALTLAGKLASRVECSFILFQGDPLTRSRIPDNAQVYEIGSSFKEIRRRGPMKTLMGLLMFFPAMRESMKILQRIGSDIVISHGGGSSYAPMVAAKLLRRKVIFVESASRIRTRSLCGWATYLFLADLFFVQWPEARELYPRAIYAGRLI